MTTATRTSSTTTTTASAEQLRDERRRFRAGYALEKLYELIRETARVVRPDEPTRLTQREFDEWAPRIALERGWRTPPSARALYMRVNGRLPRTSRKPWTQIVGEACDETRSVVQTLAAGERSVPRSYHDERFIHYSLRRVGLHLGHEPGGPGPTPDAYDRGREELLAAEATLHRAPILSDLLVTSGQLTVLAGEAGWAEALELAGYSGSAPAKRRPYQYARGHWEKRENVVRALAEYVELYDGQRPLRQKHYLSVRAEHSWPAISVIAKHGRFQELVDEARRIAEGPTI